MADQIAISCETGLLHTIVSVKKIENVWNPPGPNFRSFACGRVTITRQNLSFEKDAQSKNRKFHFFDPLIFFYTRKCIPLSFQLAEMTPMDSSSWSRCTLIFENERDLRDVYSYFGGVLLQFLHKFGFWKIESTKKTLPTLVWILGTKKCQLPSSRMHTRLRSLSRPFQVFGANLWFLYSDQMSLLNTTVSVNKKLN